MTELSNALTARARILHRTRVALKAFGYNRTISWIGQNMDRESQDAVLTVYTFAVDNGGFTINGEVIPSDGIRYTFSRNGPEALAIQDIMRPILKRATEQSFKTLRERYIESKK